jgi:ABC-type nitrate/sulfonate/bicarbonate transport system substrate-binding protein
MLPRRAGILIAAGVVTIGVSEALKSHPSELEETMQPRTIFAAFALMFVLGVAPLQTCQAQPIASATPSTLRFKAASEGSFEWFFLPVDAAKDQGLWSKYGLEPEFVPAPGTAAQLKERIDAGAKVGFANTAEVTLAKSNGVPVKAVAGYFGVTGAKIFVATGGPIKEPKDLNHKKIGILATTHTSYRTVLYLNKKLDIQVEPVPLGALANNLAALKAGHIDAFYSAEGAALALVDSGDIRLLIPLPDVYPKPYAAVVIWATDDAIERAPDLVAAFVKATLQSVKYLQDHPSYASELYIKRTGSQKNVADKVVAALNAVLTPSGRGSGSDLVASVAGNWRFMTESGAVSADTAVNIEEVVDARFLPPT